MTACGVCGTPCRPPFRAPAAELAPDLDGRPGEPARATLRRWVQVCRGCGAAAPDLAALTPAMAEIVRGRAVQEEANPFLRWAALIEATDGDAGEALLQAAWLVEDEGGDAAGLRRLAAAAWRGDGLRKLDILRRAGAFEEALSWAESLGPLDEAAQAIVAFQRGCIARGDAGRHDLGSALRPPARRPHAAHGQKAERPRLGVFGRLFGR